MIKAVIIDNDISDCHLLKKLITQHFKTIDIVGVATGVKSAIKLIANEKPELIFLDIEMLTENELSFFDKSKNSVFEIIIIANTDKCSFLTHYISALHYLKKPVELADLQEAICRFITKIESGQLKEDYIQLQKDYNCETNKNIQLPIKTGTEYTFIDSENIIYGEADLKDTLLYMRNLKKPLLVNEGFGSLLARLPNGQFFQIHKSLFIRSKYILKLGDKGEYVIMINDKTLNVADRLRSELLQHHLKK